MNPFRRLSPSQRTTLNWALVVVWGAVIWMFSSIPDLRSGFEQDFILRKLAHGLEFAVLVILIFRALPVPLRSRWQRYGLAALLAVAYAAVDEIHQGYVPGREPAVRDVAIDALGVTLGLASILLAYTWLRSRSAEAK
ncbi:MAG: VanZ family protein [Candidatus Andersenbacteria bacterium]